MIKSFEEFSRQKLNSEGVFDKTTWESCSNKMIRDAPSPKDKGEMIKPFAKRYARPSGGTIGRGTGVSSIQPPKSRGVRVSLLKKTLNTLELSLALVV